MSFKKPADFVAGRVAHKESIYNEEVFILDNFFHYFQNRIAEVTSESTFKETTLENNQISKMLTNWAEVNIKKFSGDLKNIQLS